MANLVCTVGGVVQRVLLAVDSFGNAHCLLLYPVTVGRGAYSSETKEQGKRKASIFYGSVCAGEKKPPRRRLVVVFAKLFALDGFCLSALAHINQCF